SRKEVKESKVQGKALKYKSSNAAADDESKDKDKDGEEKDDDPDVLSARITSRTSARRSAREGGKTVPLPGVVLPNTKRVAPRLTSKSSLKQVKRGGRDRDQLAPLPGQEE